MKNLAYGVAALASAALLLASWRHWVPFDPTEALGFVTGAWCVWLTVIENIWNWPLGIANNIFFILLFLHTRLFADMGLQVVYVVLSVAGWYWWLYGGQSRTTLLVARMSLTTATVLTALVLSGTFGMTIYLRSIHDAAPFWDALTTTLSLAAQYLLTKKLLENWYVWMVADVIYVALYVYKHLYLTCGLYLLFLGLCVLGLREWQCSLEGRRRPTGVAHG